jgi:hypothetical protein
MRFKYLPLEFLSLIALIQNSAYSQAPIDVLPAGYFICYTDQLSEWSIPFSNNSADYTKANEIIKNYFAPITVISSILENSGKKDANDIYNIDRIPMTLEIGQGAKTTFKRRTLFAIEGGGSFAFYINVSGSAKYKYISELDLSDSDPGFTIRPTLDPRYLINLQEQLKTLNKRPIVLFSKNIFAPGMLFKYTIKEAKEKADIKLLSQEGEYLCELKESFSNRPILRKFQNEKTVRELIENPNIKMFVPGTSTEYESSEFFMPNNTGSFTYDGKKWQLSHQYMEHLKSEGVVFAYKASSELGMNLKPKQIDALAQSSNLLDLIYIRESAVKATISKDNELKATLIKLDKDIQSKTYGEHVKASSLGSLP